MPIEFVSETVANTIRLRCSKAELEKMDPFVKTEFIEEKVPYMYPGAGDAYGIGRYYFWPYVSSENPGYVPVARLQIPPGELAVHRGTRIEATDGYVGQVDEFVIQR